MEEKSNREISCSDINCRRPAGAVFLSEDKWMRPAQNCAGGYGKGLCFYSFNMNDQGEYFEEIQKMISPEELNYSKKIYLDGMLRIMHPKSMR